jgi:uncharacterized protein (TIGR03067 family)
MGSAIGTEQQPQWEYLFVQVTATTQKEYRRVFRQYETAGWEFAGSVPEVIQTALTGSAITGSPGAGLGGPPGGGISGPGGIASIGAAGGSGAGMMAAGETTTSTSLVFKRRVSSVVGGMGSPDQLGGIGAGMPGGNGIPTPGMSGGTMPMGLGGHAGGRAFEVSDLIVPNRNLEEADVKRLLNGSWSTSKQTVDGKETSTSSLHHLQFSIENNQLTIDRDRKTSYFINPTKLPQELNIVGNGTLLLCIYQLKGDTLRIAFYGRSEYDRPKSFDHAQNTTTLPLHVMQFHREAEKDGGR